MWLKGRVISGDEEVRCPRCGSPIVWSCLSESGTIDCSRGKMASQLFSSGPPCEWQGALCLRQPDGSVISDRERTAP
jgi:hypothetical protein